MTELMNEWMNYEPIYRTAPATPGLSTRHGRPNSTTLSKTKLDIYILFYLLFFSSSIYLVCYDIWHLTRDISHVTFYMWHMTQDTKGLVNIASKFQVPSSNSLGVMMFWRLAGKGSLTEWMNQFDEKGVCRTATTSLGLLATVVTTAPVQ